MSAMNRRDQLLEKLRQYFPDDALENSHRSSIIDLLTMSNEPFSRAQFAPGHITAGCFIIDGGARLLLHHHRRLGRWLQMGGHLEEGEDPTAAALREGQEESGLRDLEFVVDGIFDVDVHAVPAGKNEPDHHHFDVRFLARTATPDAIAIDHAESNDLAWVVLSDALPLMNEEASSRVIRKIERRLRGRSA